MSNSIVPQLWRRVKMGQAAFYTRVAKNALAETRRIGGKIEVFVADELCAVYSLRDEVLSFTPANGANGARPTGMTLPEPLAQAPPSSLPATSPPRPIADPVDLRRSDDGRPLCPKCGKVMVVKFNVGKGSPFWSCSTFNTGGCRGTRNFQPHPDDFKRAGELHDVAVAYSLQRYLGADFAHLHDKQDEEIELRRRAVTQKVTGRTLAALHLVVCHSPTAKDFRARMWPSSRGNPGYLTNLTRRGFILNDEGRYRLTRRGVGLVEKAMEEGKL